MQHAKCPSCHRILERNLEPPMDQWRLPPQVASIGGTITVRATPTAMASGGIVRQIEPAVEVNTAGTITASGGITSRATVSGDSAVHVEAGLRRTQWDLTCTSFGLGIGGLAAGKPGAIIGGVTSYVWARRQWPEDD
jgi:hypothetical protein